MSVYVDNLHDWGWRLGPSCHLVADTLDELHEFAKRIGMKRSWFQPDSNRREPVPHYDLVASKRRMAVKLGAIELDREDFVAKTQPKFYAAIKMRAKKRGAWRKS